MGVKEQFHRKLEAQIQRQRSQLEQPRRQARWQEEQDQYRREVDAMKPIVTAMREIRGIADFSFTKHGHASLTVEGLDVTVRVTKTRSIYIFGEQPNQTRHFTPDEALDALTDHIAKAVARRMVD